MARFGKKGNKAEKAAPKAAAGGASPKKAKQPKPPKASKPSVPPDMYTLLLGLSALFLLTSMVVLGWNYYWYQTQTPPVIPLDWAVK